MEELRKLCVANQLYLHMDIHSHLHNRLLNRLGNKLCLRLPLKSSQKNEVDQNGAYPVGNYGILALLHKLY